MLAKIVNDDAGNLGDRRARKFFASKLAPTVGKVSDVYHSCFRLLLGISLTNLCTVAANSAAGFDRPTLLTNCYALHPFRPFLHA